MTINAEITSLRDMYNEIKGVKASNTDVEDAKKLVKQTAALVEGAKDTMVTAKNFMKAKKGKKE